MNLLGIDIGGTKTSVCIGNERGEILTAQRISMASVDAVESYRKRLVDVGFEVLGKAGLGVDGLDAIGISAPGPMDVKQGLLLAPPNNPGWKNVPIVEMVSRSFKAPVYLNNDANACAVAEYEFGGYGAVRDLVYLTCSTGMGGGVIANGELIQGCTDTGGEVGHHVLDPHGPPCGCGQQGCWEAYVGGRMVAERVKAEIRERKLTTRITEKAGGEINRIDMYAIELAARDGDAYAVQVWEEFTERLAQGIGNLIMILNPQVVVLGTMAIKGGDFYIQPILRKLPRYAWKWPREACRVVPSALGSRIGDLAALAVALSGLRHAHPQQPHRLGTRH